MVIERLRPDETDRLRAIRLAALEDAPYAYGTTLALAQSWGPEQWVQQLEQFPTFVATETGLDVGLVRAASHRTQPGVANLISMWVAPAARGTGVGEALVKAVIDWARSSLIATLLLDVSDDNPHAIRLYDRMGFQPTGVTGSLPPPREHVLEHERALALR